MRPAMMQARRGYTLAELLVALTVFATMGGALVAVVRRQQRAYRGIESSLADRAQLNDGAAIVSADLRGLSAAGGDILARTDSSIDFRATIGGSVACAIAATTVDLPPDRSASGDALTWWSSMPQAGDLVMIFDEGASAGDSDDQWRAYRVARLQSAARACAGSPYVDSTSPPAARYRLTIAPPDTLSGTVTTGAPIRFLRRTRYALYRAGDGLAYLGQSTWDESGPSTIQPVSGPYSLGGRRAGTARGLTLRYYDPSGGELLASAPTGAIGRIGIVFRGWRGRDSSAAWATLRNVR